MKKPAEAGWVWLYSSSTTMQDDYIPTDDDAPLSDVPFSYLLGAFVLYCFVEILALMR